MAPCKNTQCYDRAIVGLEFIYSKCSVGIHEHRTAGADPDNFSKGWGEGSEPPTLIFNKQKKGTNSIGRRVGYGVKRVKVYVTVCLHLFIYFFQVVS